MPARAQAAATAVATATAAVTATSTATMGGAAKEVAVAAAPAADTTPVAPSKDTASVASVDAVVAATAAINAEEKLQAARRSLTLVVPLKIVASFYLLGPVIFGECRSERLCAPWAGLFLLVADVVAFSGHLFFGIKSRAYTETLPTYNFYFLLVFWSVWNFCSHPLCRQHGPELFVAPSEVHLVINVAAIALCSSTVLAPPSTMHVVGLVMCEFLISLGLSSAEVLVGLAASAIEALSLSLDNGWLSNMQLDIVVFNVAILLIGSTIILGTMTVEKDIKTLASEMENRLGPAGSFDDDLERRKRAILTALCDAVLTTNATFTVTGSGDGADRIFRKPMLNEVLTDYLKDDAEKERFLSAVRKQFPEDAVAGEGPKRMRLALRDKNGQHLEADVVVSDASTDKNGRVNKYMVGMHLRGEYRARMMDDSKLRAARATAGGDALTDRQRAGDGGGYRDHRDLRRPAALEQSLRCDAQAELRSFTRLHDELSFDILLAMESTLQPQASGCTKSTSGSKGLGVGNAEATPPDILPQPRFHLRRTSCEVFRRRSLRPGDRPVDLRRLSLPESST